MNWCKAELTRAASWWAAFTLQYLLTYFIGWRKLWGPTQLGSEKKIQAGLWLKNTSF